MTPLTPSITTFKKAWLGDRRFGLGLVLGLWGLVHALTLLNDGQPVEDSYIVFIFYASALWYYHQRGAKLKFSDHPLPQLIGGLLSLYFAGRAALIFASEVQLFWYLVPPFFILALTLIADGWRGIKTYWRLLLGITAISWFSPALEKITTQYDLLTVVSAKVSAYFLWYLGFKATSREAYVFVNDGTILINAGCTAFPVFFSFLNLLLILWLFYPRTIKNIWADLAIAFGVSFILSILRLAIMAVVVNDPIAFNYWHGTEGSNLFMSLGLLSFGGILFLKMPPTTATPKPNPPPTVRRLSHSWLASGFLMGLALILGLLLLGRQGNAEAFSPYVFPKTIDLPGWDFVASDPLPLTELKMASVAIALGETGEGIRDEQLTEIRDHQTGTDIILDGRHYRYQKDNLRLTVSLRYVVNSLGDLMTFYENHPALDLEQTAIQAKFGYVPALGDVLSFSTAQALYFSGCVTPQLDTSTASYALIMKRYDALRQSIANPLRFLPWLTGEQLLLDDRCLWMQLKLEPKTVNSEPTLKTVWQDLMQYWSLHYPSLR